jgi:hypothetical protein
MKFVGIVIGLLVAAGIGYFIVQAVPDIQRYMRIRSM